MGDRSKAQDEKMMDKKDVEEDERRLEIESRISEWMKKSNEKARCTRTYTSCQAASVSQNGKRRKLRLCRLGKT